MKSGETIGNAFKSILPRYIESLSTLFCITAPSGTGKTVVMRKVMDNEIVSFTTRGIRENEVDGVDYLYISMEEFNRLKETNGLIEETCYSGNYYGITQHELTSKLAKGSAFVIVDYNGVKQLNKIYPHCINIFMLASKDDALKKMSNRGDNSDSIVKRLETYDVELENRIHFDYVITNEYGKMDDTVEIIKKIVELKG
jgi:guanylate kinase